MAPSGSGLLVVLEGVDRCGKTTQCARLVEQLTRRGVACEAMRFPCRDTAIGKVIDSYLRSATELSDQAVHLLFSANRWEMSAHMRQRLAEGVTLVVDRYTFSGQVFTFAKGGIDMDWCRAPDLGLPEPDLVMFLDLPVEQSKLRGSFGEERYEKEAMQRRVREAFLDLAKANERGVWRVVDASESMDQVERAIWQHVHKLKTANGN